MSALRTSTCDPVERSRGPLGSPLGTQVTGYPVDRVSRRLEPRLRTGGHDEGVPGRRTTVAVLLLAALTTGCDDAPSPPPAAAETPSVSVAIPELEGALGVRLVTGTQVFGLGCRQRTEHDACSADGRTTYTWVEDRPGARRPLTLTSARMHRNAEHTAWMVAVRFARTDRDVVRRAARRAAGSSGYTLVIDDRSGQRPAGRRTRGDAGWPDRRPRPHQGGRLGPRERLRDGGHTPLIDPIGETRMRR